MTPTSSASSGTHKRKLLSNSGGAHGERGYKPIMGFWGGAQEAESPPEAESIRPIALLKCKSGANLCIFVIL